MRILPTKSVSVISVTCPEPSGNSRDVRQPNIERNIVFFDEIIPLEHPRFITQYNLKNKDLFIERYMTTLCN